jgi:hypothetical protein
MPGEKQDEGKQPSFTVSDRRSFSESGEPKPAPGAASPAMAPAPTAAAPAPTAAAPAPPTPTVPAAPQQGAPETRAPGHRDPPVVDFHTFILSLGSSALLHLGELDQPDGTESRPDLPLAKHTIDIIVMLQEKTKGNLSPPEEHLIESLLYDLRLRYVERSKLASG